MLPASLMSQFWSTYDGRDFEREKVSDTLNEDRGKWARRGQGRRKLWAIWGTLLNVSSGAVGRSKFPTAFQEICHGHGCGRNRHRRVDPLILALPWSMGFGFELLTGLCWLGIVNYG